MSEIIGPIEVMDTSDAAELAAVRDVVSRMPAEMTAADGPGRARMWLHKRFGAPAWAWGYTPNRRDFWVNPAKPSETRRQIIAHEYWHGWQARHAKSPLLAQLRPFVTGTIGKVQTSKFTNRLSEALADGFARSLGFTVGVRPSYYRARVPDVNLGGLIETLGKAAARLIRATHTLRRSEAAALRREPLVSSPAVDWAESGDAIRAALGRSGGLYAVPMAGGDGLRSRLWLQVDVLRGRLLEIPLWTAELLWCPVTAEMPPLPPAQS